MTERSCALGERRGGELYRIIRASRRALDILRVSVSKRRTLKISKLFRLKGPAREFFLRPTRKRTKRLIAGPARPLSPIIPNCSAISWTVTNRVSESSRSVSRSAQVRSSWRTHVSHSDAYRGSRGFAAIRQPHGDDSRRLKFDEGSRDRRSSSRDEREVPSGESEKIRAMTVIFTGEFRRQKHPLASRKGTTIVIVASVREKERERERGRDT